MLKVAGKGQRQVIKEFMDERADHVGQKSLFNKIIFFKQLQILILDWSHYICKNCPMKYYHLDIIKTYCTAGTNQMMFTITKSDDE